MGIRISCPNGHKLNVKDYLAGKRGVCPSCGAKFIIPPAAAENGGEATVAPVVLGEATSNRPPSGEPNLAAVDSPSMIISVTDSQVDSPAVPQRPALNHDPSMVNVNLAPAAPAASLSNYAIRRARRRRLQLQTALFLLVAVVILLVVLIVVLNRGPAAVTSSLCTRIHLASAARWAYVADDVSYSLLSADQVSML